MDFERYDQLNTTWHMCEILRVPPLICPVLKNFKNKLLFLKKILIYTLTLDIIVANMFLFPYPMSALCFFRHVYSKNTMFNIWLLSIHGQSIINFTFIFK